ncbi:MAG: GTPase family protein [Dolichospermum sp.]
MNKLRKELQEISESISSPNIVVIGRTGAGKSSLINVVFGEELAKTGAGLPVSNAFIRYPKSTNDKSLVVIYDSAGYEMGKENQFKQDVFNFINEKKSVNIEEQIHLVWYVVHAGLKRFEHFDADIIKMLQNERVPVLIIISQCDIARAEEINKIEEDINNYTVNKKLNKFDIIRISAFPIHGEPFGVKQLVDKTVSLLPELYSEAFIARQIVNLEIKRKQAVKYINFAAVACFATGFVPIPFTSPTATIAAQTTLCKQIASLYGYAEWVEILDQVGNFTITSIITYVTTSAFDLLSFMFPPGSLITGGLAGTAAAAYLVVVGFTYLSVFDKLTHQDLNGAGKAEIEEFIKNNFKKEFKRFSEKIKINSIKDLENLEEILKKEGV